MKIFYLLALISLLGGCATTGQQQLDWQLMLHHDAQGQTISGSKQQLITAVESGRPIRIVWPLREDFIHVADAGFLTVMNGEVFAQFDGIIRQIPDRETRRSIALDAENQSQWHAIVGTTGALQAFQSSQGQLNSRQFEYKWYALTAD